MGVFLWLCLLICDPTCAKGQDPASPLVEINGLRSTYAPCELVNFSVKNVSQQEVYVEVYAEKFESGSWEYVDYAYDIKDPKSLYVKRVLVNPDMLKPGTSLPLTYNRCLKPTFVKESEKSFRSAIIKKDWKSTVPILQHFMVLVYVLDQGHVKFVQKAISASFERIADEKSVTSPVR
jgi:hypothetical protein